MLRSYDRMLLTLLQAFGRPPTDEGAVIAELTRRFSRALKQQIVVESVRVTLLDRTALGAEVVRAELPLMQAEVQRAVAEGVRGLSTSEATCATRPDAGGCAPSLREMLDGAVGKVLSDAAPSVVAAAAAAANASSSPRSETAESQPPPRPSPDPGGGVLFAELQRKLLAAMSASLRDSHVKAARDWVAKNSAAAQAAFGEGNDVGSFIQGMSALVQQHQEQHQLVGAPPAVEPQMQALVAQTFAALGRDALGATRAEVAAPESPLGVLPEEAPTRRTATGTRATGPDTSSGASTSARGRSAGDARVGAAAPATTVNGNKIIRNVLKQISSAPGGVLSRGIAPQLLARLADGPFREALDPTGGPLGAALGRPPRGDEAGPSTVPGGEAVVNKLFGRLAASGLFASGEVTDQMADDVSQLAAALSGSFMETEAGAGLSGMLAGVTARAFSKANADLVGSVYVREVSRARYESPF